MRTTVFPFVLVLQTFIALPGSAENDLEKAARNAAISRCQTRAQLLLNRDSGPCQSQAPRIPPFSKMEKEVTQNAFTAYNQCMDSKRATYNKRREACEKNPSIANGWR